MERALNLLAQWGVFLPVWLGLGLAHGQTIGTIPNQSYAMGATSAPVVLTLSGFQTNQVIRTVAANITSGNGQSYEGPGTRILQGLQPDVVMIQEFNVSNNTTAQIRGWVDSTFGAGFQYFRESTGNIPNGVISRWPILQSGSWDDGDSGITDRGFAWARIDIPGPKNLWVISLHLKASSGSANVTRRDAQAQTLVDLIAANVPAGDYLLIGGDCNTYSYTETCLSTLGSVVDVSAPRPVDQAGDPDTNAGRSSPYDWVMAEPELDAREVAVTIGSFSFPSGLVFDSRVFSDLSLVSPVQAGDSGASNMQHMAVVRSFEVDAPERFGLQVTSSNATLLPVGNIQVLGSGLNRSLQIVPAAGQTGSSTVTVTASDGVATVAQSFSVTVTAAQSAFQTWAAGYGLSGTNAATTADPDGDGWINGQEFAFGLVPNVRGGQPVNVATGGGKITYLQRSGVTYSVRSATDLTAGFGGTVIPAKSSPQPAGLPAGYEQWEATLPAGNRGFLKVEATISP